MIRSQSTYPGSGDTVRALAASRWTRGVLGGLVVCLAASCQSHPNYADMDAAAKAREITRHRRRSQDALASYFESRSEEDLLRVVENQRVTTDIAPSTCPTCYRDYGKALSMLGRHYYYQMVDARQQAEVAADPAEARQADRRADELEQKMREAFERSYRAYFAFFTHPDTKQREPQDFFRVMKDAELQENWGRAREYLGYFTSSIGDNVDSNTREYIRDLSRHYQRRAQIEQAQTGGAAR